MSPLFLLFLAIAVLYMILNLARLHHLWPQIEADFSNKIDLKKRFESFPQRTRGEGAKATVAYVISITACKELKGIIDGAAVLQHSIHLNSIRASNHSSYDYAMVAFVHPEASNCSKPLGALGYQVQVRETPIRLEDVRGEYKLTASKAGCCGELEWLKLYAFVLTDHPVAVHLDLDVLILQPLDNLFDAMLFGSELQGSMWNDSPKQIDAFFTRDYNMVIPGKRKVHQVGVQGGFLVVRPDQQVFDEFIEIILEGNFSISRGWGLMYGGYYGAATIQGLAAFYYGHVRPGTAVELNRCLYNNMADNPRSGKEHKSKCRSMQEECEDCRHTDLSLVRSIHYTECFKPWKCIAAQPHGWKHEKRDQCRKFHREWFGVRYSLEQAWKMKENREHPRGIYLPNPVSGTTATGQEDYTFHYCRPKGDGAKIYIPLEIPQSLFDGQNVEFPLLLL